MASQPEVVVADAIAAALGGSWAVGTNIFRQQEQPPGGGVPHHAIFVAPYGGPPPEPYLGTGTSFYKKNVQRRADRACDGDPGGRVTDGRPDHALHVLLVE